MWTIVGYFLIGVMFDALITWYYLSIGKGKAYTSGWLSTVITLSQCLVLYNLFLSPEFVEYVIAYSIGCGLGTFCIVRLGEKKFNHKSMGK